MVLANIGNVEGAQRPVEAVSPRIAQAECEDLVGAGAAIERVVPRPTEQHVVSAQPTKNVRLIG